MKTEINYTQQQQQKNEEKQNKKNMHDFTAPGYCIIYTYFGVLVLSRSFSPSFHSAI